MLRPLSRASAPLYVLLFTWALSLCAPALHERFEILEGSGESRHATSRGAEEHACSGQFAHHDGVVVHEGCAAGDDCSDPKHHHHSPFQHDATHCPACASSLERASELPSFRFAAPRVSFVAVVASVRVATPAERHVFALARGPPASADVSIVCAHGI